MTPLDAQFIVSLFKLSMFVTVISSGVIILIGLTTLGRVKKLDARMERSEKIIKAIAEANNIKIAM